MTNLPIIGVGIFLGFVLHITLSDKLVLIGLSMFGISQNNFVTAPVWFIVSALIILVCAVVTSYLCGRSISKLNPVAILAEE
jgi:ABC-type antimicrobial peptide transport system permease subunit